MNLLPITLLTLLYGSVTLLRANEPLIVTNYARFNAAEEEQMRTAVRRANEVLTSDEFKQRLLLAKTWIHEGEFKGTTFAQKVHEDIMRGGEFELRNMPGFYRRWTPANAKTRTNDNVVRINLKRPDSSLEDYIATIAHEFCHVLRYEHEGNEKGGRNDLSVSYQVDRIVSDILNPTPDYTYSVVATYPHDMNAFTQGFFFNAGHLYESTGSPAHIPSSISRITLDGQVVKETRLESKYFGEGAAIWKDEIFQLTWKHQKAFVFDLDSLNPVRSIAYPPQVREGWGLTANETHLILSDGSDRLYFLDPVSFSVVKTLQVKDKGLAKNQQSIYNLNELEWVSNEVFANIWKEDRIARIDPETGEVKAWINLLGLHRERYENTNYFDFAAVLNGIAYDPAADKLFVTGKKWSKIYEIQLQRLP